MCQQLLAACPYMARAITCTTRAPRQGEKDGVDYYFLGSAEFQKHVRAGDFIEHAEVFGRGYGTLHSELLDKLRSGRNVLLNVDVQGAATIRERAKSEPELEHALITVFLTPSSFAVLEERLTKRNTDAPEEIQKRLSLARHEIAQWRNFDYLLISSTMAEDLRRMLAIIEVEKLRVLRAEAPLF